MKVLVVEDDLGLVEHLSQALSAHHYQVEVANNGTAGLTLIESVEYDLVLLDWHLPQQDGPQQDGPQLDGIDVCRHLRSQGYDIPVLMMTAETASASKVMGLDAGADDYITKPLDFDELLARMRSLLRRGRPQQSPLLSWGAVSLNPGSCEVFCCGQRLHLTSKEYAILELLLRNPHRIFSLDALIERLWPLEKTPSENAVRTHIKSMRRKLDQAGVASMIETVYGLGYRLGPVPVAEALPGPLSSSVSGPVSDSDSASGPASDSVLPTANTPSSKTPPELEDEALKDVWKRHRPKYLDLIASLSKAIPVLSVQTVSSTAKLVANQLALTRSQAAIHTLKGALGSLGFTQASEISAQIETLLRLPPPLLPTQLEQLLALIEDLKQSLDLSGETSSETSSDISSAEAPFTKAPLQISAAQNPASTSVLASRPWGGLKHAAQRSVYLSDPVGYQWLIIDNDPQVTEQLLYKAKIAGVSPHIARTLGEAQQLLEQRHIPMVVTFDPCCAASWEQGVAFLAELIRQHPLLPVIVTSEQANLAARINIVRSGGCTFLQKPVSSARMLEMVQHLVARSRVTEAQIMVLDDDPLILQCLRQLLSPWGFQLTLLSDPLQFWSALENSFPDLLILDIEMPSFNGLDLCRVIRSDPKTAQVPVLFLSAHTHPDIVRQVFDAGADDYINKPIIGPELVGRILNRLERLRFFRKLAETDSLTGLSRRRHSLEALNRLLKLSMRQNASLCLALLDLDHFKQINDRYGHDAGDQVLTTLGDYLRKSFRGEDVVARWGGEEFVVGLYDVSEAMAMKRLNALREAFGQHLFQADSGSPFQVSLSGGLSISPGDGDTIQAMYRHADKALYRAKAAGRNQICAFGNR
ncbi:MAG: response regulator [Phormidesmis sp.]